MKLTKLLGTAFAATIAAVSADARERGTGPTVGTVATLGVPAAASPPPGLYWMNQLSFATGEIVDGTGTAVGLDNSTQVWNSRLMWVPGTEVLGGSYRAWIGGTYVNTTQTANAPLPPFLSGDNTGFNQFVIQPLDISWRAAPNTFVNLGFGIHTPASGWDSADVVHTGGNFWTASVSAGFAYIANGWLIGSQLRYFHNFENKDNGYRSGDEVVLDFTAMRDVGDGWSLGPVAYGRWQVTDDENNGGLATYGGAVFGKTKDIAVGLAASKRLKNGNSIGFNYTKSIESENTFKSDNTFTVNFSVPLGKK